MFVPVINRISPQLPRRGEGIRRTACHDRRPALFIQLEEFRMAPCIGAVQSHVDRQIPQDLDPVLVGIVLERFPLPVEHILHKTVESDLIQKL